jgi:repressor LexA
MAAPLTPLERKVYHYLLDFLAEHSFQPSLREIGRRFSIGSTKTVMDLLIRLEEKGYIERGVAHSRGVRLIGYTGPLGAQPVPLYARAHAAPPALRREDIVRHYALDRHLLAGDEVFLTRVVGDATASRGVLDGDLAIVHPTARAADDGLVALRIGEWIHVRAVRHDGAALIVESPDAPGGELRLGRGDDFGVLGVVEGIVRPPVALDAESEHPDQR